MNLLNDNRFVPVVEINDPEDAVGLAQALCEGGISIIEVTLRTQSAWLCIERILKRGLPIKLGVGSILTTEQYRLAQSCGAAFGVSPMLTPSLTSAAKSGSLPLIPGVATPSEALVAYEAGFEVLKFFPAVPNGGVAWLQAVNGPLPLLKFIPTGGVGADNANEFLSLSNVAAVGGSWITPKKLIQARDFKAITQLAIAANKSLEQNG
jgi:2-dehydro-3-deoxyphosphogluconate aldolase / (4S)-4-hydroxy-2-oxoglutarate aldolase